MHAEPTRAGANSICSRARSRPKPREKAAIVAPAATRRAMACGEIELLASPAQRVKKQMTAPVPRLRAVSGADGHACRTAACPLPARESHVLCDACEAVYAAAFALHEALIERNGTRMELECPGIIEATRRALFDPPPDKTSAGSATSKRSAGPDAMVFRRLEDARVPIDWQVDQLEEFVAELRAIALVTERST